MSYLGKFRECVLVPEALVSREDNAQFGDLFYLHVSFQDFQNPIANAVMTIPVAIPMQATLSASPTSMQFVSVERLAATDPTEC